MKLKTLIAIILFCLIGATPILAQQELSVPEKNLKLIVDSVILPVIPDTLKESYLRGKALVVITDADIAAKLKDKNFRAQFTAEQLQVMKTEPIFSLNVVATLEQYRVKDLIFFNADKALCGFIKTKTLASDDRKVIAAKLLVVAAGMHGVALKESEIFSDNNALVQTP